MNPINLIPIEEQTVVIMTPEKHKGSELSTPCAPRKQRPSATRPIETINPEICRNLQFEFEEVNSN